VESAVQYLIDVLTGRKPLDRAKAIRHALTVLSYVVELTFPSGPQARRKPLALAKAGRHNKAQVVAALTALKDVGGDKKKAVQLPAWLLPVLANLLARWLAGR
jgi:hypothetical protein